MKNTYSVSISMLALITGWSAVPMPAFAQVADSQAPQTGQDRIEDIVVTAQRRAENIQNVPIAITALSGDALVEKGISNILELAVATPGLTFTTGGGYALPRIRGVGASTSAGGIENSVATYVDDVYIASSTSSLMSLSNIEQIAVLKGPQGTLFGRNATGGLIQITTRDPKQDFSAEIEGTYGNHDTIGGKMYVTGGLTDNLAADLAVYYQDQRDGFGTNLTTGDDINKARDLVVRSKFILKFPATTVKLSLDYANTRNALLAPHPISLPSVGPAFTGGKFDIATNLTPTQKVEQGGVSLNIQQDLSFASFRSITAYRKSRFVALFDNDGLSLPLVNLLFDEPDRQFSQELQLVSNKGGPLDWTVGGYYFWASAGFQPLQILTPTFTASSFTTQRTKSISGFAQATYEISPDTKLTAGLRYTDESKYYDASARTESPSGGLISTSLPVNDRIKASKLTWRLALNHEVNEGLMVYASYNRGFKSGGYNSTRTTLPLLPFDPEVLDAFEIGAKSDFLDRRVRLNVATYYYDYKNIQLSAFNLGTATIYNAASAKIYGADVDVTIVPTSRLMVDAGLSFIHSSFGDFPGATISTPIVNGAGMPTGGNILGVGNAKGNRLPQTPSWTLNLGARYEVPIGSDKLQLAANYFHSDGWVAEPDNRLRQKPYDILNGSVTMMLGSEERIKLVVWGRNLTNNAYATQIASTALVDKAFKAAGRTFGVTFGYRY